MKRALAVAVLGLGLSLGMGATSALATVKISELVSSGYTCERVATNFRECKKAGGSTYWCTDNGDCEVALRQVQPTTPHFSSEGRPTVNAQPDIQPTTADVSYDGPLIFSAQP